MTNIENQILTEKNKCKDYQISQGSVSYCMKVIGGKWKPIILFLIFQGTNRFGIMHRAIEKISKQMLTKQLRELEKDDILKRVIYAEIPPRVEYFLTKKGLSLCNVIRSMKEWGEKNMIE